MGDIKRGLGNWFYPRYSFWSSGSYFALLPGHFNCVQSWQLKKPVSLGKTIPERDRLVLSKAHCCEAIYAALVELGVYPKSMLETYYCFASPFQGHADRWCTPGIDYSGGSLGQGLSFAVGMALAEKMKMASKNANAPQTGFLQRYIVRFDPAYRSYCILGDGECQEGMVKIFV